MMTSFLISALVLGLFSSLHCLGMCGPLVIGILPQNSSTLQKSSILFLYHAGRFLVYGILGVMVGWIGQSIFIADFQQFLSIGLGVLLFIWAVFKYFKLGKSLKLNFITNLFSKWMGRFLTVNNPFKYLLLGGLNGLLPCGMVYIALAGAFSVHSPANSFLFMLVFGLGTLPLLVSVSSIGTYLKSRSKNFILRAQPVFLILFATLLIVRGLNLGIPYLSPQIVKTSQSTKMECCQKK